LPLHLNIEDLLSARTVESDRIEFKEGWNPDAIYRSICAFANDFDNIGGGYILIGVVENENTKTAQRPVKGLTTTELSEIQNKMFGFNNLLLPAYHPHLFIEEVDSKKIIVLWIPGGSSRPYLVPEQITAREKRNFYYIRKYANSVKANTEEQQELISLANQIPFDDRANTQAKVEDISLVLVKNYLSKINSKLAEQVGKISDKELLAQMELVSGPDEHIFPRNVGLMMFSDNPELFFPCTRVEIVDFPNGDAGSFEEQEPITGPIPEQINRVLKFLKDKLVKEKVIKPADKAESIRIASYPYQAIEETLVNAFYHRDYQQREPIEIRIYPNSIVFINHGGPDRSIRLESFNSGQVRNRRYRNRRLGEFLKELELTEGRATGIPTILKSLKDNGSPPPHFKTDDDRTFFELEIFIHHAFNIKKSMSVNIQNVKWDLEGIDNLLNSIVDKSESEIAGGIVSNQVSNQADWLQISDNQSKMAFELLDSNQVSNQVSTIAGGVAEKHITILKQCNIPKTREDVLSAIKLSNQRKNYVDYMQPLVELNWLTMTIPNKPTSPNQKYLTTLKGRLILEILKRNKKLARTVK
jgi:ATP-dependent DNA helicase RecG